MEKKNNGDVGGDLYHLMIRVIFSFPPRRQERAGFRKQWIQFYICITGVVILKIWVKADEEVVSLVHSDTIRWDYPEEFE